MHQINLGASMHLKSKVDIKLLIFCCRQCISTSSLPLDPRTSDKIYIKVGRSNSLDARLASWTQHYSPAVIRHIYPRKDMTTDLAEVPAHMFLESLIHTELGDLERHAARYYTNFPNAKPSLPGVQMSKSRCIKADCVSFHHLGMASAH